MPMFYSLHICDKGDWAVIHLLNVLQCKKKKKTGMFPLDQAPQMWELVFV